MLKKSSICHANAHNLMPPPPPPPRRSVGPSLCTRRGAQVKVKKPTYAQVCVLEAIEVNGVDSTSDAAFERACDLGVFATPEGLHKVRWEEPDGFSTRTTRQAQ